jgi:RHS repeat-associated protein
LKGDTNCDGAVSFADINPFVRVLGDPSLACNFANCDVNGDGVISFADINPFVACLGTSGCGTTGGGPPRSGTFVLHGRPVDVLPDGHVLMNFRARYYDVKHGRWLQRDRSGYADGGNLYEAFRGNAERFTDPEGRQSENPLAWWAEYLAGSPTAAEPQNPFLASWAYRMRQLWLALWAAPEQMGGQMSQALALKVAPLRNPPRLALGFMRDTTWVSDEQVPGLLREELGYTGLGGELAVLSLTGSPLVDRETAYELAVLGPAKGAALSLEGLVQIPIDLANLVLVVPQELAADPDQVHTIWYLPRPEFVPNDLFFPTSETAAGTSRFLGGNAILVLAPEAWVRLGAPASSGTRVMAEIESLPYDRFGGVREASAYLRSQGVSRMRRVEILQAFERGTITLREAGASEFGLRYFSEPGRTGGSWLFETFPASRASLAVKPEWNAMTGFRQFQIRPRTPMIRGRAAPQGPYLPGGQPQSFILDWRASLIEP